MVSALRLLDAEFARQRLEFVLERSTCSRSVSNSCERSALLMQVAQLLAGLQQGGQRRDLFGDTAPARSRRSI